MARPTAVPLLGIHYYGDGLDPQPSGFHLVSLELLDAVARYGRSPLVMASANLLAPAGGRPTVGAAIRRFARKHGGRVSLAGLGLDRRTWPEAAVWHGVHGSLRELLQWREVGITGDAPLTAMQHGYPELHGLFDLLFYDVRPWDTFICSSNTSKSVVLDMIDALSRRLRLDLRTRLPMRLEVVPYGVDVDKFRPRRDRRALRQRFGLPEDAVIVLVLGRISPAWKGDLLPLLAAFRRVTHATPGRKIALVLAGYFRDDESYRELVTHYIRELGLETSVILLGDVPPNRRHLLLAAADVCAAISDFLGENFGLVPLEAMACGVPQLVSSWNGYRDTVVDGETGFCVSTSWAKWDGDLGGTAALLGAVGRWVAGQTVALDTEQLANRLQLLVDDAGLRASMSRASRRRAEREFSWRAIVPRFEQVWSESMAMARRDSRAARSQPRTSLYDVFKRQASEVLDDDLVVELAANGGSYPLPIYGELELFFSEEIAAGLLGVARAAGTMRVGELLRRAEKTRGIERPIGTRHLLFLLKHGMLILPRHAR
jgi:glycosyltransferase involved in cell wall biosynthesis